MSPFPIHPHRPRSSTTASTEPPVIELQGISAGQLSLVLTQYTLAGNQHPAHRGHRDQRCRHRCAPGPSQPPCPQLRTSRLYALASRPRRSRGPHRGQRFRPHRCKHQPDPGPGLKGQPERPGRSCRSRSTASPRRPRWTSSWRTIRRHCSSDELQHRLDQQRHPRNCGDHLCAEERGGPAGHRRGRPADRGRRGPAGGHGAPILPDANGLPGRTGPPGLPPRRA